MTLPIAGRESLYFKFFIVVLDPSSFHLFFYIAKNEPILIKTGYFLYFYLYFRWLVLSAEFETGPELLVIYLIVG